MLIIDFVTMQNDMSRLTAKFLILYSIYKNLMEIHRLIRRKYVKKSMKSLYSAFYRSIEWKRWREKRTLALKSSILSLPSCLSTLDILPFFGWYHNALFFPSTLSLTLINDFPTKYTYIYVEKRIAIHFLFYLTIFNEIWTLV